MTEDEIEAVAEELSKAGGLSWYPGRERGSLLRVVSDRSRDRDRLAIAALDRHRAQKGGAAFTDNVAAEMPLTPTEARTAPDTIIPAGTTVVYRPPGERRAYPCRVEKVEGDQIYLVPHLKAWTGWVPDRKGHACCRRKGPLSVVEGLRLAQSPLSGMLVKARIAAIDSEAMAGVAHLEQASEERFETGHIIGLTLILDLLDLHGGDAQATMRNGCLAPTLFR